MATPVSYASITLNDSTRKANGQPETSVTEFAITTLTPGNVAAQATLLGNLKTSLAGVIIGVIAKDQLVYQRDLISTAFASSSLAQRENKWLCRYSDNTSHKNFVLSFGTADLTILPTQSEFVDLSAGPGAAFKSDFEAFVVSPDDASHSVTLNSMQFVGRNS